MPTASSTCPNCGAPLEFSLGSSLAKVCEYCRHTVVRSDRGLEQLGQVADLALTPALIAVGDEGTLGGRALRVLGRVQLDYGEGPWDEYYVAFDAGQSFGWLAYAQGEWYVTALATGIAVPPYASLELDRDLMLGDRFFRVAEVQRAYVLSIEGEFNELIRPGMARLYADCFGATRAFATLDYGEGNEAPSVFMGFVFSEPELRVSARGPRSLQKVPTITLRCPNCGGDIPKLMGDRAERVGCPYCGAISDIVAARVINQQERARTEPNIPLGLRATLAGQEYIATAYLRREASFDGEPYSWDEYLLWSQPVGFRWLVKDPETGWSFVAPVSPAEIDRSGAPGRLQLAGKSYALRNENVARVTYVLGEVYWKCALGESTRVTDYAARDEVLSREANEHEVHYSLSAPIPWPVLASAFGLPLEGGGSEFDARSDSSSGSAGRPSAAWLLVIAMVIALVLLIALAQTCGGSQYSPGLGGASYRGTGVFYGGK
jgi:ribosomal protein S27AE